MASKMDWLLSPPREAITELNSDCFVRWLEQLTGDPRA